MCILTVEPCYDIFHYSYQQIITMFRQILKPIESRLTIELPPDLIGHEIEVLAFAVDIPSKSQAANNPQTDLLSFANTLHDSPNFNGDLVEWQQVQRDEWR